ncbi:MAG TPA: hypothetical protein VMR43_03350 [Variovorax sp.]|nr:hypothetical protein [Variovorax sp.]
MNPDLGADPPVLPSLMTETRPTVGTATAAYYMNRRMQTLHRWHSCGSGPIKPFIIQNRLAWPVAEIRRLMLGQPAPVQQAQDAGVSS